MNLKKKLFIIVILTVFYLIIAVNFHKIKFTISMLRLYDQEKKIESMSENMVTTQPVVDNPLQIILDSVDVVDKSGDNPNNPKEAVDNSIVDKVEIVEEPKKDTAKNESNKNDENNDNKKIDKISDTKDSYTSIINDYNTKLELLKSTFKGELDELIQSGIEEYSKGNLSNSQLAAKYLSIGADLEKSSDTRFNKVLKDMEKELKTNGHNTSIIKDIKNYYTSFKDARKMDLISRGMKHVKQSK